METKFLLALAMGLSFPSQASRATVLTQWETALPNEEADIRAQAEESLTQMQQDYGDKGHRIFRNAHPRSIACMAARFTVNGDLPAKFQTGVFAVPGKTYDALIRYSNARGPMSDHKNDLRGMAIKLLGVPGKKLLEQQADALTQDFILLNAQFSARDAKEYGWIVHLRSHPEDIAKFLLGNPILRARELKMVRDTTDKNPFGGTSLASQRFSSTVPYLLKGPSIDIPVKFVVHPCGAIAKSPLDGSEDELRNDLQSRLRVGELCYEFGMQFYRENAGLLIEDAMNEWKEEVTPFVKFATIRLPKQEFLTDEKYRYCDNLSFQPWHSLPEHRPLGNVNRARKIIYEVDTEFRHKRNGEAASLQEPTSLEDWKALQSPRYKTWDQLNVPAGER